MIYAILHRHGHFSQLKVLIKFFFLGTLEEQTM